LSEKFPRSQLEARLANLPPCLIGMEACVGGITIKLPAEVCESERRDGEPKTGDPNGLRGLSANQLDRRLRSMMARNNEPLQSEAGYIDARPKTRSPKSLGEQVAPDV
jgi:hypothetical protein